MIPATRRLLSNASVLALLSAAFLAAVPAPAATREQAALILKECGRFSSDDRKAACYGAVVNARAKQDPLFGTIQTGCGVPDTALRPCLENGIGFVNRTLPDSLSSGSEAHLRYRVRLLLAVCTPGAPTCEKTALAALPAQEPFKTLFKVCAILEDHRMCYRRGLEAFLDLPAPLPPISAKNRKDVLSPVVKKACSALDSPRSRECFKRAFGESDTSITALLTATCGKSDPCSQRGLKFVSEEPAPDSRKDPGAFLSYAFRLLTAVCPNDWVPGGCSTLEGLNSLPKSPELKIILAACDFLVDHPALLRCLDAGKKWLQENASGPRKPLRKIELIRTVCDSINHLENRGHCYWRAISEISISPPEAAAALGGACGYYRVLISTRAYLQMARREKSWSCAHAEQHHLRKEGRKEEETVEIDCQRTYSGKRAFRKDDHPMDRGSCGICDGCRDWIVTQSRGVQDERDFKPDPDCLSRGLADLLSERDDHPLGADCEKSTVRTARLIHAACKGGAEHCVLSAIRAVKTTPFETLLESCKKHSDQALCAESALGILTVDPKLIVDCRNQAGVSDGGVKRKAGEARGKGEPKAGRSLR